MEAFAGVCVLRSAWKSEVPGKKNTGVSRVVKVPVPGDAPDAGAPRLGVLVLSYMCGSDSAMARRGACLALLPGGCLLPARAGAALLPCKLGSCPASITGRNRWAGRCRGAAVPSGCAASRVAAVEFVAFKASGTSRWNCGQVAWSSTGSLRAASFSLTVPALPVPRALGLPGSAGHSPVWEGAGGIWKSLCSCHVSCLSYSGRRAFVWSVKISYLLFDLLARSFLKFLACQCEQLNGK